MVLYARDSGVEERGNHLCLHHRCFKPGKKKLKASHTAQKVQLFEVSCTVNSARYGHL